MTLALMKQALPSLSRRRLHSAWPFCLCRCRLICMMTWSDFPGTADTDARSCSSLRCTCRCWRLHEQLLGGAYAPSTSLAFPCSLAAAGDAGRWVWRAPPPMELLATVVVTGTTNCRFITSASLMPRRIPSSRVAMSPFLTHW